MGDVQSMPGDACPWRQAVCHLPALTLHGANSVSGLFLKSSSHVPPQLLPFPPLPALPKQIISIKSLHLFVFTSVSSTKHAYAAFPWFFFLLRLYTYRFPITESDGFILRHFPSKSDNLLIKGFQPPHPPAPPARPGLSLAALSICKQRSRLSRQLYFP